MGALEGEVEQGIPAARDEVTKRCAGWESKRERGRAEGVLLLAWFRSGAFGACCPIWRFLYSVFISLLRPCLCDILWRLLQFWVLPAHNEVRTAQGVGFSAGFSRVSIVSFRVLLLFLFFSFLLILNNLSSLYRLVKLHLPNPKRSEEEIKKKL